jgi:hypothetical protein
VSPLSSVIVQVRLGRFNRRSAAWRLAGGSSLRRANFLQAHEYLEPGPRPSVSSGQDAEERNGGEGGRGRKNS